MRNGYVMQQPRDVDLQSGRGNIICLRDLFQSVISLPTMLLAGRRALLIVGRDGDPFLDLSHKQGPMRYAYKNTDVPTCRSSRSSKDGGISNQFKSPGDVTPTLLYGNGGRLC